MKTILPKAIASVQEAKAFYAALHFNGEAYNPEDSAMDIEFAISEVSEAERKQLDKLQQDVYNLPELANYPDVEFDPCGYLIDLDKR